MRVFVVHKSVVLTVAITALIAVFLGVGAMPGAHLTASEGLGALPIYSVETEEKKVAVTFNAAWGDEDIESILETLSAKGARCTFFLVGTWAEKFPDKVEKIKAAGHEIAGHSYNHAHFSKLSSAEVEADMAKCDESIRRITGEAPRLFRAPYGEYTEEVVRTARASGKEIIQWDIDSLDWKGLSPEEMEARILPRLGCGSILLFHTGTAQTAAALPGILEKITKEGYSFTTVGALLHTGAYTVDHTGRQHAA